MFFCFSLFFWRESTHTIINNTALNMKWPPQQRLYFLKSINAVIWPTAMLLFQQNISSPQWMPSGSFRNASTHSGASRMPRTECIPVTHRPESREAYYEILKGLEMMNQPLFGLIEDNSTVSFQRPQGRVGRDSSWREFKSPPKELIEIDDNEAGTNADASGMLVSNVPRLHHQANVARIAAETHTKLKIGPDISVCDRIDEMMASKMEIDEQDESPGDVSSPFGMSAEVLVEIRRAHYQSEWMDKARAFLSSGRQSDSVQVIEKFDIPIDERKLSCLRPVTWLNDEIINFYMEMLRERDAALCATNKARKPSHFFNSFFIDKLLERKQYNYKNVKRSDYFVLHFSDPANT